MIKIVFKNLEESEFAKDLVDQRIRLSIEKFPDLQTHKITVTLGMENSPFQAGPDLFTVKLVITGKKYREVVLEKSAMSLYVALADISEHLLERLNRFGDKDRVKKRNSARKLDTEIQEVMQTSSTDDLYT